MSLAPKLFQDLLQRANDNKKNAEVKLKSNAAGPMGPQQKNVASKSSAHNSTGPSRLAIEQFLQKKKEEDRRKLQEKKLPPKSNVAPPSVRSPPTATVPFVKQQKPTSIPSKLSVAEVRPRASGDLSRVNSKPSTPATSKHVVTKQSVPNSKIGHAGGKATCDLSSSKLVHPAVKQQKISKEAVIKRSAAPVINFDTLMKLAANSKGQPIELPQSKTIDREKVVISRKVEHTRAKSEDGRDQKAVKKTAYGTNPEHKINPAVSAPQTMKRIGQIPKLGGSQKPHSNLLSGKLSQVSKESKSVPKINDNRKGVQPVLITSSKKNLSQPLKVGSIKGPISKESVKRPDIAIAKSAIDVKAKLKPSIGSASSSKPTSKTTPVSNSNKAHVSNSNKAQSQAQVVPSAKTFSFDSQKALLRNRAPDYNPFVKPKQSGAESSLALKRKQLDGGRFDQSAAKRQRCETTSDTEEEEEDSDMDSFIDDTEPGHSESEADFNNYSKHIRDIFGYDRRKYKNEVDDRRMEVRSFRDIMKEEALSARAGLLEDLKEFKRGSLGV